jgi:sterol desaturase/sphingolipid hydroxylase (fatty acid hydroxylase superfamily)
MAPESHGSNFGAFFGLWDHLFGTLVSPDRVPPSELGIPDEVSPTRYLAGL